MIFFYLIFVKIKCEPICKEVGCLSLFQTPLCAVGQLKAASHVWNTGAVVQVPTHWELFFPFTVPNGDIDLLIFLVLRIPACHAYSIVLLCTETRASCLLGKLSTT